MKFILDYITLQKQGIAVDLYNIENFILNDKGIFFIDLDLSPPERFYKEKHPKYIFEIIDILGGSSENCILNRRFNAEQTNNINKYRKIIIRKICNCFAELGFELPTKREIFKRQSFLLPKNSTYEYENE